MWCNENKKSIDVWDDTLQGGNISLYEYKYKWIMINMIYLHYL